MIDATAMMYGGSLLGALALSLIFTPVALRFAVRRGVLDHPGLHKSHQSPVPYLGGTAIVVAFALSVMVAALVGPRAGVGQLAIILGAAVGLAFIGLVDDLRGLNLWFRLLMQAGAAAAVISVGVMVSLTPWPIADVLITLCWIVGVTNALNLLDNMDGLSAGVSAIAAFFIWVMAAMSGQYLVASLSIALAGCCLGFLRHNFHPARIYMGDAGSLFLGFLLSVLTIKLAFDTRGPAIHFVPVLVLGVPIFDTCLVTVARVLHGRGPLAGGLDHASHRLVFVGIPVRASVALIYTAAISLGWLSVAVARVDETTGLILTGLACSIALLVGVLLGAVPVYGDSKRRRMMIREVLEHEEPADVPATASARSR